jgi:hypothetical protein
MNMYKPIAALLLAELVMTWPSSSVAYEYNQTPQNRAVNRGGVSTNPSSTPFVDPLMQPLPPAVSANRYRNNNRSNLPLNNGSR